MPGLSAFFRFAQGLDAGDLDRILQMNSVQGPWLAPYGGIVAPADHHARHPAEALYSEVTHRVAGAILLTLAALTAWEAWRPRRFPWNAVSAQPAEIEIFAVVAAPVVQVW